MVDDVPAPDSHRANLELVREALRRGRVPLGALREILTAAVDEELRRRGRAARTRRTRLAHLRRFLRAYGDHRGLPDRAAVRRHLRLLEERPPSPGYVEQRGRAVACLYALVRGAGTPAPQCPSPPRRGDAPGVPAPGGDARGRP